MAAIKVQHLHKRYGDRIVVRDVSFRVERGEIFGILGPDGAGKTTTVECVAGLRVPDGGGVSVLGLDPRRDAAELRQQVGMQLQESRLPDRLRVGEALELYRSFYRRPADPGELMERFGLADQRDTEYQRLSDGQRQRLSIALALVGSPRIAILDEPTTGLDPRARLDTWELIEQVRDGGVTVVLVTHLTAEARRLCDRVAVIDAGRVTAVDSPAGLISRTAPEQRIRFRPTGPLDDRLLAGLPQVTSVVRSDGQVTVTGTGDLLHAVSSLLARNAVVVADLRVEQADPGDPLVELTRRRPGTEPW